MDVSKGSMLGESKRGVAITDSSAVPQALDAFRGQPQTNVTAQLMQMEDQLSPAAATDITPSAAYGPSSFLSPVSNEPDSSVMSTMTDGPGSVPTLGEAPASDIMESNKFDSRYAFYAKPEAQSMDGMGGMKPVDMAVGGTEMSSGARATMGAMVGSDMMT